MALARERISTSSARVSPRHGRRAHPSQYAFTRKLPVSLTPWLGAIAAVGASWLVRLIGIDRNYDIFIDEVTYTRIADNLATGHGLVLYGMPFDLHPPAVFGLYALIIRVFGLHGNIAGILFELRPFAALIGSISCALAYLLVGGITNWRVGAVAAVIVALDPFEIFYDSHVMLEAVAQLASVLAILLLVRSLHSRTVRRSWELVILSGVAAGFAMCAKENYGLVLGLTLVLALVTAWTAERRKVGVVLAIMCGCYLLSESLVIASTGLQSWWSQSTSGLRRLVGSEQISGFNSPTVHVSLVSRLAADANYYGVTYAILGFGTIAGVLQVLAMASRRRDRLNGLPVVDRGRLLVALWSFSATIYICYTTLFGTLEEQMYYLLFIPGLCTLIISASHTLPRLAPYWRKIAIALLAAVVVVDSAVWVSVHGRSDDEYRQLLAWAPKHLPAGSTVSVTDEAAQFLLQGIILGQWATIPALIKHHVDYVLLSTTLVNQGYGSATHQFEQYLQSHAPVVFRATGPSEGALIVYNVQSITSVLK